jgi:hypothetical protein
VNGLVSTSHETANGCNQSLENTQTTSTAAVTINKAAPEIATIATSAGRFGEEDADRTCLTLPPGEAGEVGQCVY